jgi:phenylalanyl-tRNA synthetase beta chain
VKKISATSFEAVVPSWRLHDVAIPEDLAEEIARVYGYFRLESKLPITADLSVTTNPLLDWEYQAKKYLSDLGFTEIFNYSLVSRDLFEKTLITSDHSITLTNPLSSEFEYMRPSLIPSLLMNLEKNQGKVDQPVRIFELSNIYTPDELPILTMATQGLDYRRAKGYLEALLQSLHFSNINFVPLTEESNPWQKNQTAEIYSDRHLLGVFGAINSTVKTNFSLTGDVYLANLDFKVISGLANSNYTYAPVSEYPNMIEDITIQSNLSLGRILQLIKQTSKLITKAVYKNSLANKHTFTIHFNDSKRNLTQNEVNKIKELLLKVTQKE